MPKQRGTSIIPAVAFGLVGLGLVGGLVYLLPRLQRNPGMGKPHTDDPAVLRQREIDILERAMIDVVNDAKAQGKSDEDIEKLKAGYRDEINRLKQEAADEKAKAEEKAKSP